MSKLIGFCGYAMSGKTTIAHATPRLKVLSFATALRAELYEFVLTKLGIDIFNPTPEEKKIVRPLMVGWGAARRAQNPDYWIEQIKTEVEYHLECGRDVGLDDVRYLNEVLWIQSRGGRVLFVNRPGTIACNEEEARSFREIPLNSFAEFLHNTGTLEEWKAKGREI